MMYDLPRSVVVNGEEFSIRSDYRAILDILSAIQDDSFTAWQKAVAVMAIFYADGEKVPDWEAGIQEAFAFISCEKEAENAPNGQPRLVDWEQDFPYIIAAVNKVAGREVRLDAYCHWWTFMGYFDALDGESTFGNIVRIRSKKAKGQKLEPWELAWYKANRGAVDLKKRIAYTAEEAELRDALRGKP